MNAGAVRAVLFLGALYLAIASSSWSVRLNARGL